MRPARIVRPVGLHGPYVYSTRRPARARPRCVRECQRYGPLHQVWRTARPMAITSANKPRGEYTERLPTSGASDRRLLVDDSSLLLRDRDALQVSVDAQLSGDRL
ncbi:hypothetical protein KM043_016845 [Ampulex compressa]|nr:hypothetical protein KM043_016845 [Ampulex compressa]